MSKKKPSFVVVHPVKHGFTVLTTAPRASAMKAAREALEKAKGKRVKREQNTRKVI